MTPLKLFTLTMTFLLATSALCPPVFAQRTSDISAEIDRLFAALDEEEKQVTSGTLQSLRWQLDVIQRLLRLFDAYRTASFTSTDWYANHRGIYTSLADHLKGVIASEEDYIRKYGKPRRRPCEQFFDWGNDETRAAIEGNLSAFENPNFSPEQRAQYKEILTIELDALRIQSGNCIGEMRKKYPAAWNRLKALAPMVEFSVENPPTPIIFQRAFVESGTVAMPRAATASGFPLSSAWSTAIPPDPNNIPASVASAPARVAPRQEVPLSQEVHLSQEEVDRVLERLNPPTAPIQSAADAISDPMFAAPAPAAGDSPTPPFSAPDTPPSPVARVQQGVSNIVTLLLAVVVLIVIFNMASVVKRPIKWVYPKAVWFQMMVVDLTTARKSAFRKVLIRCLVRLLPKEYREAAVKRFLGDDPPPDRDA